LAARPAPHLAMKGDCVQAPANDLHIPHDPHPMGRSRPVRVALRSRAVRTPMRHAPRRVRACGGVVVGRSERVRKKWVVRRVVEFLGIWVAIYFIGVQYISPVRPAPIRPRCATSHPSALSPRAPPRSAPFSTSPRVPLHLPRNRPARAHPARCGTPPSTTPAPRSFGSLAQRCRPARPGRSRGRSAGAARRDRRGDCGEAALRRGAASRRETRGGWRTCPKRTGSAPAAPSPLPSERGRRPGPAHHSSSECDRWDSVRCGVTGLLAACGADGAWCGVGRGCGTRCGRWRCASRSGTPSSSPRRVNPCKPV
jgi:hypothetical protein